MPSRKMHNLIAQKITRYNMNYIDKINAKVDSTVTEKGFQHREDFHDLNPLKKDSLEVTKGSPKAELVRKIHITLDLNPKLNRMAKNLETIQKLNRRKHGRH